MPPTTITGTVFAPNGTLPLYGVKVYVPEPPIRAPLPDGAQCTQVRRRPARRSDRAGDHRRGRHVHRWPTSRRATNIPLVIVSGKWRRQITIPTRRAVHRHAARRGRHHAAEERDRHDAEHDERRHAADRDLDRQRRRARVPRPQARHRRHGDHGPMAAPATSTCSPTRARPVRASASSRPAMQAAPVTSPTRRRCGITAPRAEPIDKLSTYDIVILSCEGDQYRETKPQAAMDAMKAYADLGGRVFMSHWHNIWIEGASTTVSGTQTPAVWPTIATWSNGGNLSDNAIDRSTRSTTPRACRSRRGCST